MQQKIVRLEDLCTTRYYSSQGNLFENGTRQLAERIVHADKGSAFYNKFEQLFGLYSRHDEVYRRTFANDILSGREMEKQGYDALLLHSKTGEVIGSAVYQSKDDGTRHMFSLNIDPQYENQGLGTYLSEQLTQMFISAGVKKARFGAGGKLSSDEARANLGYLKMNRILKKMAQKGYRIESADKNNGQEGWIDLSVNPIQKAA